MVKYQDDPHQLDLLFAALGDGTRRGIVAMLSDGREHPVGDLAAPFHMSLPAVTKHLRVLEDAAVVSSEKRGRTRYCRLQPQVLRPAMDWLEHYRRFWEQRFDELETFLDDTDPERDPTSPPPPPAPPQPPSTLGYDPFPDFFPGAPPKKNSSKPPAKSSSKTSKKPRSKS